ncbi:MAG: UDP-N-acetylglucosamine--N-acetylmuramyl-(pentapeptide) pyrophosphoryl-undecaprenol N-acetylglucosamine transferase [Wolbachia endosymbiont of Meromenopon meropis]|nr:UDP-N-acetylglucosamine--N-acetylmuramyl-(pentapeptide) pyrophosphoryl-undecaprenol N-acetylglucosamine transferase [Wolbachia endosymbiont of Meromenopon meropis]
MDIILTTGGTGGHIFPAITLATELKTKGYSNALFTNKKIDPNIDLISYVLPLPKPSGNKFKFFLFLIYSCALALYQVKKLKPKLVIGFGSYASFPILFAAKILSVPIILHEQNTILGRINRFFFKEAKFIATSFPKTKYAMTSKCIFTGNFINIMAQSYFYTEKILNILIIAGSQGSKFFDDIVSDVIYNLSTEIEVKIRVTQQCTKKNMDRIRSLYDSRRIYCELSEFFDDIENRLASADLIVSRAGATSIAEITLAERPAVYIPYPYSKDGHQFYNARYIKDFGAAVIVEQNRETKKKMKELLIDLLQNSQKLRDMANNTKKIGIRSGVTKFVKMITQELKY